MSGFRKLLLNSPIPLPLSFPSLCLRAEGVMRTMSVEKLLKGMPTLQSQIDALLDFEVSDIR